MTETITRVFWSWNPVAVSGLALWIAGILWMMPGGVVTAAKTRIPGLLFTVAGLVLVLSSFGGAIGELSEELMFWVFAIAALLCGTLMITSRNPVYAALWFALATLSTCGLFMLQSAPFLAAATVIVYAGAVIVTFLFVIMLAQQSGAAGYDQTAGGTLPATLASFLLLGAVFYLVNTTAPEVRRVAPLADSLRLTTSAENAVAAGEAAGGGASLQAVPVEEILAQEQRDSEQPAVQPNLLSRATESHPVGSMKGLGRSLFGDYLFAVELAGTILLIACIGAIAVAPRREEGAI
jgi:NADH-quinone oxidoreductase subunit J